MPKRKRKENWTGWTIIKAEEKDGRLVSFLISNRVTNEVKRIVIESNHFYTYLSVEDTKYAIGSIL